MNRWRKYFTAGLASLFACLFSASYGHAEIIEFTFDGAGGQGILATSEPGDTGNGSGGLLSPMQFDTDTNELFIDVGWGSGNGFVNLSSNVNLLNIHGPTTDEAPDNYGQSAGALLTLNGIDPSPLSGGFTGNVAIPEDNVPDLISGKLYLHIHTDDFTGGEARGYFVRVNVSIPEPATAGFLFLSGCLLMCRRDRGGRELPVRR